MATRAVSHCMHIDFGAGAKCLAHRSGVSEAGLYSILLPQFARRMSWGTVA